MVPLEGPAHGGRVGLVTGPDDPTSVLARALLAVAREAGVREALDALLRTYLDAHELGHELGHEH